MLSVIRKQGNDHVYIKLVEFLTDTIPQKYTLSEILKNVCAL